MFSTILHTIGGVCSTIGLAVSTYFLGLPPPMPAATSTPITIENVATSSPPAATPSRAPATEPAKVEVPVSPVVNKPIPPPPKPPVVETPPVNQTIGTTTLVVQTIPLLSGGVVRAGQTVPISYLQITNIGTEGARLTGFRVQQNGSAPDAAVIGLSTVDDRGGSRGLVGGDESSRPFRNGVALAPTDAYFAPGQMRLFTIKAILSGQASAHIGMTLAVVVTSVETTADPKGQFPISGTTWTIQ